MFDITLGSNGLNNNIKINEFDNKEFLCNERVVKKIVCTGNKYVDNKQEKKFHVYNDNNGFVANNYNRNNGFKKNRFHKRKKLNG